MNYQNNPNYQIPYQNIQNPNMQNLSNTNGINPNDDRFLGALAFPFLLGGVTGAALAPAFWRPSPYGRPQSYPVYPNYGYPMYPNQGYPMYPNQGYPMPIYYK